MLERVKRFLSVRAIALGFAVAAVACAASFALAVFGFGRIYYAAVFMPVAMLACLALAWFSFLRVDGLARRVRDEVPAGQAPVPAIAGRLEATMYAPRDGSLVPRGPSRPRGDGSLWRAALVWAALGLGVAATILYSIAGVGSRFY